MTSFGDIRFLSESYFTDELASTDDESCGCEFISDADDLFKFPDSVNLDLSRLNLLPNTIV